MTLSVEIKAKCNASKTHYDKTAGPEHTKLNIGEFVYVHPLTSKPGSPWAYGRITGKRHARSYTIQTPHSTIQQNWLHIRHAAPPSLPTPPCTPPILPTQPRTQPHATMQSSGLKAEHTHQSAKTATTLLLRHKQQCTGPQHLLLLNTKTSGNKYTRRGPQ